MRDLDRTFVPSPAHFEPSRLLSATIPLPRCGPAAILAVRDQLTPFVGYGINDGSSRNRSSQMALLASSRHWAVVGL